MHLPSTYLDVKQASGTGIMQKDLKLAIKVLAIWDFRKKRQCGTWCFDFFVCFLRYSGRRRGLRATSIPFRFEAIDEFRLDRHKRRGAMKPNLNGGAIVDRNENSGVELAVCALSVVMNVAWTDPAISSRSESRRQVLAPPYIYELIIDENSVHPGGAWRGGQAKSAERSGRIRICSLARWDMVGILDDNAVRRTMQFGRPHQPELQIRQR